VEVWSFPGTSGRVSVPRVLARLARDGVTSVMVEGGSETLWGFFRSGLVDRVAVFGAPTVLGGRTAPGGVGGEGFALGRAVRIVEIEHEPVGVDWLVTGLVARPGRRRRGWASGR
jgi:diaminohydroxyphosphoribosylaminopyrimidine deaminase/5-amino-6-(5-phosphoribosylamino)uracil reductase